MAAEVNGNSTPVKEDEEPMDITVAHTENYQTLIDAGLPQKVAASLDNIFQTGLVAYADLDERAIDALREFNEEGALSVLQQFKESDLSHVQNKSAFLCGVMKTYRQREKQGSKVQESTKGPDEAKIKALLERTGYTLDVTTGQRKYGGPPPEEVYTGSQPAVGTEVFVGKIPRDLYEDELVPLFEKAGAIWDLRLMMDPLSGQNRGYAFITFCNKDAALEAVKLCDNYEIRSGKYLGVCISVANNRLFVGSIPKNKTRESILEDFSKVTEGLTEVILYHQPDDKKKNRGFCFLEYEDHKSAAQARRRLMSGKVKVWGNPVTVEWADPVEEPDPDIMAKVKVLFVRNLATPVTEELLENTFSQFGKLERVKKLKDYAFVHFEDRDAAVKAMQEMNGKELEGEEIEIVLAKPPDKKRKERQAQRQTTRPTGYDDYYYYPPPRMPPPMRGRGRGGRGNYAYPPDYYGYDDYYDDYYGYDYHDYRGGYEDPYYGYDDGYVVRGRGGRVNRGAPPPPRGRGVPPPRGRGGYGQRGAPMGVSRGSRGGRGGPLPQQRGRGPRGTRGNRGGNVGGKRKADGYNQPDSKRRQTAHQNWGSQPIAQQPLQQGGDYSGEDARAAARARGTHLFSAVFFSLSQIKGLVREVAPGRVLRHAVDSPVGAARKTRTSGQFFGKEVLCRKKRKKEKKEKSSVLSLVFLPPPQPIPPPCFSINTLCDPDEKNKECWSATRKSQEGIEPASDLIWGKRKRERNNSIVPLLSGTRSMLKLIKSLHTALTLATCELGHRESFSERGVGGG
ncbi:heterogeneous nuclear ribonucleoprotein R-like isoform X1 [Alosa alosa]|uniref:heterogeneous nuclear ribonucleoprotein R-like isoform X1 n=1 Tax=Alosa alosa TaxID=278164 RepID=UPI0020153FC3|nr:heterogeneous nuclear ribonucleoprotein R-like isoform X1 [Alosa alosa]